MEVVAHALWAAAAAVAAKRSANARVSVGATVWWASFPDVLAFGPSIAAGLWLRVVGGASAAPEHGHILPHVHVGLPLYPAAHSIIVFSLVFGLSAILAHRVVLAMLGWLLHILIDIPTHSLSYYATRFLWPVSDVRFDGIAWWTPWVWAATYAILAIVFIGMWRKGWLSRRRWSEGRTTQV